MPNAKVLTASTGGGGIFFP